MRNYYVAYLRGIRDYCQAYHGGSIRQAMIDLAMQTGTETRPELLHKYPWPARSPNGSINVDSMLDMQAWFVKNKMSNARVPGRADRRQELRRLRSGEARAVRAREQGQHARGLPLTLHAAVDKGAQFGRPGLAGAPLPTLHLLPLMRFVAKEASNGR